MCATIGVDPLASNKGFWAEVLGFGDFYYKLGVQILAACWRSRGTNGGLMELDDLMAYLQRTRPRGADKITTDDIERAFKSLKRLGNGLDMRRFGSRMMVVTVPMELSRDHEEVLRMAKEDGREGTITSALLIAAGWDKDRVDRVLGDLLRDGLCWVDDQGSEGREYFFPSMCLKS